MFHVIHSMLLIPFIVGGMMVGSAFGPVLGAVDGLNMWHKIKEAHDADVQEKAKQKQTVDDLNKSDAAK